MLCSIELLRNDNAYQDERKSKNFHLVSPDYKRRSSTTRLGQYACAWHLQAAATVLGMNIISVYPPVNGLRDETVRILNITFSPLGKNEESKDKFHILWTNTAAATSSNSGCQITLSPCLPSPISQSTPFKPKQEKESRAVQFSDPIQAEPLNEDATISAKNLLRHNIIISRGWG